MRITGRTLTLLTAAFVLYLFANQTQVGWLYVMSAVLAATVAAALLLNRGSLRGLAAERAVGPGDTFHEGDTVTVRLTLRNTTRGSKAHVELVEVCPLAAPDDPARQTPVFVPLLAGQAAVGFSYEVVLDRRGLHTFPALALRSRAPFGFAERRGQLDAPTRVLVYPEVVPIAHLELLDRRLSAAVMRPSAGHGSEVLGVRPYRPGDSPRAIHWRSVARTGQLISKEFADEAQPGLTLLLDLHAYPYPDIADKRNPFEWAVKVAASIATYALERGYPVLLLADDEVLATPLGALSTPPLYQYLARVQANGTRRLADVVHARRVQALVAAVLPWPDPTLAEPLLGLRARGVDVLALVLEPDTFPAAGLKAAPLLDALARSGIDVLPLRYGQPLADQLGGRLPVAAEAAP